jgi:hypothetical protein
MHMAKDRGLHVGWGEIDPRFGDVVVRLGVHGVELAPKEVGVHQCAGRGTHEVVLVTLRGHTCHREGAGVTPKIRNPRVGSARGKKGRE